MVLQSDVTAARATVIREVLELALAYPAFPVGAPQLVLDDLDAVQPMLDVGTAYEQTRFVPGSDRLRHITRRRVEIVIGAGELYRLERLFVVPVVDQLKL